MEQFYFKKAYLEMMNLLPEEARMDFLRDVIFYGVYGTKNYSNNPLVEAVMVNVRRQMDCTRSKYEYSRRIGKKGGRPREVNRDMIKRLKNENFTVEEIAMIMNCSERTVQRALQFRLSDLYEDELIENRKKNYRPVDWELKRKLRNEPENPLIEITGVDSVHGWEYSRIRGKE